MTEQERSAPGLAATAYEGRLRAHLQRRIKPGLNSGAIPLLARSIARETAAGYERELTEYLQQRIKPGLNRGAVPMVARTIARAIAASRQFAGFSAGPGDDADVLGAADFEIEMHALQEQLGDRWIVSFSVHRGQAWLSAQSADSSQRVKGPTAAVLKRAVRLLNARGGRGG